MASNTTNCLSGSEPVPLGPNTCNQGFYCPNNTAENPPQYCPPAPVCLITRLQTTHNTCEQPQGIYEPIVCARGYYCPPGGKEQILCPKGSYCPLGSVEPFKCLPLSVCPAGSDKQRHLVGFLCCGIIDLLLIISLWLWPWVRKHQSAKKNRVYEAEARSETNLEKQPVPHSDEDTQNSELGSVFWNEQSDTSSIEIEVKDIGLYIKPSDKHILSGISGKAEKGSLLGIMGPSGSGKSTLVNIISGKLQATSGSVFSQGVNTTVKDLIGYVPQDDIVHPHLTVRENILFSARIRLGGALKDKVIQQHVDKLIQALGLAGVKHSLVGDHERRGVSGGERKRISIAVELVAAPRVLILDEPTSGLDARAALSTTALLKSLSRVGITVICVLHQPRIEIFDFLDNLLLLGSGKQMYFGKRSEAKQYFQSIGYYFDPQSNPADVMLDIVSGALQSSNSPTSETSSNEDMLVNSWETAQKTSRTSSTPEHSEKLSLEQLETLRQLYQKRMSPWYRQVYLCFLRDIRQQLRDRVTFFMEIFAGVLTGMLIGLAVYELGGQLYVGLYLEPFQQLSSAVNYDEVPKIGVLLCLAISFASAAPSVTVFSVETQLFHRESHSGHSESAYFVGKVLTSLLRTFLSSLHFTTFYLILSTPVISFGMLLGLNLLYFYCVSGLGAIMAAVAKRGNGPLGCLLLSIVIAVLSGHAPRLETVKGWHLAWLWYLFPGTWYIEGFFSEHILPFSYLYNVPATEDYTGFTTGRTNFDIGLVLLIGTVYRVVGCSLMVFRARKHW